MLQEYGGVINSLEGGPDAQGLYDIATGGICQETLSLRFLTKHLRLWDCNIPKVHFSVRGQLVCDQK